MRSHTEFQYFDERAPALEAITATIADLSGLEVLAEVEAPEEGEAWRAHISFEQAPADRIAIWAKNPFEAAIWPPELDEEEQSESGKFDPKVVSGPVTKRWFQVVELQPHLAASSTLCCAAQMALAAMHSTEVKQSEQLLRLRGRKRVVEFPITIDSLRRRNAAERRKEFWRRLLLLLLAPIMLLTLVPLVVAFAVIMLTYYGLAWIIAHLPRTSYEHRRAARKRTSTERQANRQS